MADTLKYETVMVTPRVAADWLGTMRRNRALQTSRVKRLAQEIREGKWILSGQPVIFDKDGRLIDGQHRLQAVLLAEKPVPMAVVRGVPSGAWDTIDSGKSRKGGDVLVAKGAVNTRLLAPTLRLIWRYELGVIASNLPEHQPSNRDIASLDDEFPEARDAAAWANGKRHMKNAAVCFVRWVLFHEARDERIRDAAEEFTAGIKEGVDLARDSAMLASREATLAAHSTGRFNQMSLIAKLIKGWNAHLAGVPVKRLSWMDQEEPFPKVASSHEEAVRLNERRVTRSMEARKEA